MLIVTEHNDWVKAVWRNNNVPPLDEEQHTFRYGIIESYENANNKLRSDIDEFMKQSDREKEDLVTKSRGHTLFAPEFLVPRQRFIGCVDGLCLMGPE